eukprot:SAG11_NODE_432_length_9520_cov_102.527863_4_plen_161_part_00
MAVGPHGQCRERCRSGGGAAAERGHLRAPRVRLGGAGPARAADLGLKLPPRAREHRKIDAAAAPGGGGARRRRGGSGVCEVQFEKRRQRLVGARFAQSALAPNAQAPRLSRSSLSPRAAHRGHGGAANNRQRAAVGRAPRARGIAGAPQRAAGARPRCRG